MDTLEMSDKAIEPRKILDVWGIKIFEAQSCLTDDELVTDALKRRGDLRHANLRGLTLIGSNLRGADLRHADLSGANLSAARLQGALLEDADLSDAVLEGANLQGAHFDYADLSGAVLRGSILNGASLRGVDLARAVFTDASLHGVDFSATNLDAYSSISGQSLVAHTRILPEGSIIGWKKCRSDVIVKLRIPEEARRSHAFGRKCRAEFVDVLEVIGADPGVGYGVSTFDPATIYRAGARVHAPSFNPNWTEECASGIHFFITRREAEDYFY